MPAPIQPFWKRRARRPWLGCGIGGVVGALVAALAAVLAAGALYADSVVAHLGVGPILGAFQSTLFAAFWGAVLVVPALIWRKKTARITPGWSAAFFAAPLIVAVLLAVLGLSQGLAENAAFLLPLFGFQALVSWGVFAYVAFPPYQLKPKKRRRKPLPAQEDVKPEGEASLEPLNPSSNQE